jgi:DNA-binding beta-propeller fold protein YncE
VVTTVAGFPGLFDFRDGTGPAAAFNTPIGVCTDGRALYVVDAGNNAIRQIDPATSAVTTVAGRSVSASIDGLGRAASFNSPAACAYDPASGDLFVSDRSENIVRRVH